MHTLHLIAKAAFPLHFYVLILCRSSEKFPMSDEGVLRSLNPRSMQCARTSWHIMRNRAVGQRFIRIAHLIFHRTVLKRCEICCRSASPSDCVRVCRSPALDEPAFVFFFIVVAEGDGCRSKIHSVSLMKQRVRTILRSSTQLQRSSLEFRPRLLNRHSSQEVHQLIRMESHAVVLSSIR